MPLTVKVRIMLHAILQRAYDDRLTVNHPVGLSHQHSIYAARRSLSRGTMVFRRLRDHFDLFLIKPLPEPPVSPYYYTGVKMMSVTAAGKAEIMTGRSSQKHGRIHLHRPLRFRIAGQPPGTVCKQFHGLLHHGVGMVLTMGSIKGSIAGNDLPVKIFFKGFRNRHLRI